MSRPSRLVVFAFCALLSCSCSKGASKAGISVKAAASQVRSAPDPCARSSPDGSIAWIRDDYAAALSCAKARKVPLVLDLWAPWCHTCLSMQSTVFVDKTFASNAAQFVFASLDVDRESNATALDRFAFSALPTFYVIGPNEEVLARFVGGTSLPVFNTFLQTGARAFTGAVNSGADAHLLAAERALAERDLDRANSQLEMAVTQAPAQWARLNDALVSWIGVALKREDFDGCLKIAEGHAEDAGTTASISDFLSSATQCADSYVQKKPSAVARVKNLRERLVQRWQQLLKDPAASLSVDDRSDAMATLRETLIALERPEQAKEIAEQQRALLDEAANKAKTPMAAMTYNWPRAEVYVYLERPLDLVPALEKSAHELPGEYDPPARLGWVLVKAGKFEEAATWTDKALALSYGPRKARLLSQRAEIANKLNDFPVEHSLREQVVQLLESLPANQTSPQALAAAKKALAAAVQK